MNRPLLPTQDNHRSRSALNRPKYISCADATSGGAPFLKFLTCAARLVLVSKHLLIEFTDSYGRSPCPTPSSFNRPSRPTPSSHLLVQPDPSSNDPLVQQPPRPTPRPTPISQHSRVKSEETAVYNILLCRCITFNTIGPLRTAVTYCALVGERPALEKAALRGCSTESHILASCPHHAILVVHPVHTTLSWSYSRALYREFTLHCKIRHGQHRGILWLCFSPHLSTNG